MPDDSVASLPIRHHYLGFAGTQWELFQKEDPPRVKPLLYVYRVLLTGIYLMRTGTIEANLGTLNDEFRLPWIAELIHRKVNGAEKGSSNQVKSSFTTESNRRLVENWRLRPWIRDCRMNRAVATH